MESMMSPRLTRWLVPALIYAAFFLWYTDLGGPLDDEEIRKFTATMTAAGVVHPPAGAHATIWADADHNWYFYVIVVLCSVVSVVPATIINNMSVKRQYPVYWGYLPKWLYEKVWKQE